MRVMDTDLYTESAVWARAAVYCTVPLLGDSGLEWVRAKLEAVGGEAFRARCAHLILRLSGSTALF